MTLAEAQAIIEKAVVEVYIAGFDVWGWDSGEIVVATNTQPYGEAIIDPRYHGG